MTLVEFSDYECPFCIRHFQQTMPQIEANYIKTGKIRYVFRDFPVDQLHPEAIRAHEAAHCAGEQSKFWEMHTPPVQCGRHARRPLLEQRAAEAGLDLPARSGPAWRAAGRTAAIRARRGAWRSSFGANGTPAFFVGIRDLATNQMKIAQAITGAQPFSVFATA